MGCCVFLKAGFVSLLIKCLMLTCAKHFYHFVPCGVEVCEVTCIFKYVYHLTLSVCLLLTAPLQEAHCL